MYNVAYIDCVHVFNIWVPSLNQFLEKPNLESLEGLCLQNCVLHLFKDIEWSYGGYSFTYTAIM